jgi:LysM repeat protein
MNYSKLKLATTSLIVLTYFTSNATILKDSVGVKKEAGKTFVLYKIEPKQTLYSIVKRYGSSVAEFKAANPTMSENVQIGQTIKIPYKGVMTASVPVKTPTPISTPVTSVPAATEVVKMATHVVEAQQGLFAIATKYKVTMAELRRWNNLANDALQQGQVLIVSQTEYERAKKAGNLPDKGEIVKLEESNKSDTKVVIKPEDKVDDTKVNPSSETSKTPSGYRKTVETGLAELIDVEDKSGKYLALHRNAPIGTLVNVKNQSNGTSIWVKVIGKFPDTGDKTIIKLSPRAFEKLNPSDRRIKAEISYMLP